MTTKILFVSGDDYAAWEFEKSLYDFKEIWEKARKDPNNKYIIDDYYEIEALEFEDEIDEEFIKFIRNRVQDYDTMKHQNFYIVD